MPFYKNASESTYERPGDGEHPGWVAAPGDVIEHYEDSPPHESFEADPGPARKADDTEPAPVSPEPQPEPDPAPATEGVS